MSFVDVGLAPPPPYAATSKSSPSSCGTLDFGDTLTPSDRRLWHRLEHPDILSWDSPDVPRSVDVEQGTTLGSLDICVRLNTQLNAGDSVLIDGTDPATIVGFSNGRVDVEITKTTIVTPERTEIKVVRGKKQKRKINAVKERTKTQQSVLRDRISTLGPRYYWVIQTGPYKRMSIGMYVSSSGQNYTYNQTQYDPSEEITSMTVQPWVPSHWEHAHILVSRVAPVLKRANVPSDMVLFFDFFFNSVNEAVLAPKIRQLKAKTLADATTSNFRRQRCIAVFEKTDKPQLVTRRDGLQVYDMDPSPAAEALTPEFTPGQFPNWTFDATTGVEPTLSLNMSNAFANTGTWFTTAALEPSATQTPSPLWNRPKQLLYRLQPKVPIVWESSTLELTTPPGSGPTVFAKLMEPGYVVLSMLLRQVIVDQLESTEAWQLTPMTVAEAYCRAFKWLIGTQEKHMRETGYRVFGMMPAFPMGTLSTVNGLYFLPHATFTMAALHMRARRVASDGAAPQPEVELFASACPKGYNMAMQETMMGMLVPQMTEQVYKLNTGPSVYPRCVRTLFEHLHLLGVDVELAKNRTAMGMIMGTWQDAQKRLDRFKASKESVVSSWSDAFAVVTGEALTDETRAKATEQRRFQQLVDYTVEVVLATIEIQLMKAAGLSSNMESQEQQRVAETTQQAVATTLAEIVEDVRGEQGSLLSTLSSAIKSVTEKVSSIVKSQLGSVLKFAAGASVLGLRLIRFCLRHPLVSLQLLQFVGDMLGTACDVCVDTFRDALGYSNTGRVYRTRSRGAAVSRKLGKALFGCAVMGPEAKDTVVYEQLDIDTQQWIELTPDEMASIWNTDASYAKEAASLAWQGWTSVIEAMAQGKSVFRRARELAESGASQLASGIAELDAYKEAHSRYAARYAEMATQLSQMVDFLFATLTDYTATGRAKLDAAKNLPVVGGGINVVTSAVVALMNLSAGAGLSVQRIVQKIGDKAPTMLMDAFVAYLESTQSLNRVKALWHAVSGPCMRSLQPKMTIDGRRVGDCESKLPVAFELMMENAPYYALTMLAVPSSLDYEKQPYEGQFQWMLRTTYALDKRPLERGVAGADNLRAADYLTKLVSGTELHKKERTTWMMWYTNLAGSVVKIELPSGLNFLTQVLRQLMGSCDSKNPDDACWVSSPAVHNMITAALLGTGVVLGAACGFQLVASAGAAKAGTVLFAMYHTAKFAMDRALTDSEAQAIYDVFVKKHPADKSNVTPEKIKMVVGSVGAGAVIGGLSTKVTLALWDVICEEMGGCTWPRAYSLHDVLAVDSSGVRMDVFRRTVTRYYNLFKNKKEPKLKDAFKRKSWVSGVQPGDDPIQLRPAIAKQFAGDFDPYRQLNMWLLNIPGVVMYIPEDAELNFDMEKTCAYFTGGFVGAAVPENYHKPKQFPTLWSAFPTDDYGSSDVLVVEDTTAKFKVQFKKASGAVMDTREVEKSWFAAKVFGTEKETFVKATPYQATSDTPVWVDPETAIRWITEPVAPPTLNPSSSTVTMVTTDDLGPAVDLLEPKAPIGRLISFGDVTPNTFS